MLSPAQEAFLDLALREPICVLTGGPGTGKTFATHIAVRLWRAMGRKVLMCAPTAGCGVQKLNSFDPWIERRLVSTRR